MHDRTKNTCQPTSEQLRVYEQEDRESEGGGAAPRTSVPHQPPKDQGTTAPIRLSASQLSDSLYLTTSHKHPNNTTTINRPQRKAHAS